MTGMTGRFYPMRYAGFRTGGRLSTQMQPVPQKYVSLADPFWAPRQRALVEHTIPHLFEQLEKAGNVENFRLAAAGKREGVQGPVYMDSDLYKALEAASLALHLDRTPPWKPHLDALIEVVAGAQAEDGYIHTWFAVNAPDKRYTNLRDAHELYCMGHLIEAALAHRDAVGDSLLMNVARRVVSHLVEEFLTRKRPGYPGHPELELALIRYFETTGEAAALDLAREFINRRGSHFFAREHEEADDEYDGTYWLDRVPVRELQTLEGHAVRGLYLMCAVTDLARIDDDPDLREVVDRVWKHTTEHRMYVTGGFGSSVQNEGFTRDYDLPNRNAYQETCASIAFVFWCERMARLTGETKYVDALERTLYNAVAASASLDGTLFFYDNPLEDDGSRRRQPWFRCACCPPNYARLVAQVGRYVWASDESGFILTIPMASAACLPLSGIAYLDATVRSDYPWGGEARVSFDDLPGSKLLQAASDLPRLAGVPLPQSKAREWSLSLRVPSWADEMRVHLYAEQVSAPGGAMLRLRWPGGGVRLMLPLAIQSVLAHPEVSACRGKFCVMRGPLVYCLEGGSDPSQFASLYASPDAPTSAEPPLLWMTGKSWRGQSLYATAKEAEPERLRLVPYALWGQGAPSPMRVWIPTTPSPLDEG